MLEIKNLSITYGENKTVAVTNFNLSLGKGEICSIVGESGSGKTTVIRAILGLLPGGGKITSGTIMCSDSLELAPGKDVTMIFQDSGAMLNPIRKIGSQYVEYIRSHKKVSKKEAWMIGVEMLERMNLPGGDNIMKSYPHQLSGGMRQRVGIAMAMTFQPKLLLADEPTSALDVTTQAQIVRQMMELRKEYETSIILVTHNIGVAAYMSDKIIVMKDGKIVDAGSREDVLIHPKSDYTKSLIEAVPTLGGKRYV